MNVIFKKRKEIDFDVVNELTSRINMSNRLASLLYSRDIVTVDDAMRFVKPTIKDFLDPNLFPDMQKVVERINKAITNKEKIVIFGDYDCDGISASAVLAMHLKSKGLNVYSYMPNRKEGYGVSKEAIDKIAETEFPDLIITVDCGTTAAEEVEYCQNDLGIDIIVTDHHMPAEKAPKTLTLNPKTCQYPTELCAAGVVFKLIQAMDGINVALKYIDIVAIATVGDIVPLTKENRVIVAFGLKILNSTRVTPGLKWLMRSNKIEFVSVYEISYMIVPRINAAGRMGRAEIALQLFLTDDPFEIQTIIKKLNEDNEERQSLLKDIVEDVYEKLSEYDLINNRVIILQDSRWDSGIIGIASAKIALEFNRPVILLSVEDGILKGSARSIPGINIFEALQNSKDLFIKFGGHSQAAGLSMQVGKTEELIKKMNEYLKKYDDLVFMQEVIYDEKIEKKLSVKEMDEISYLEPFGVGNPRPIFLYDVEKMKFTRIGETSHIKETTDNFEFLGFNMIDHAEILNNNINKTIVFSPEKAVYNNKEYIKATVKNYFTTPKKDIFDKEMLQALYVLNSAIAIRAIYEKSTKKEIKNERNLNSCIKHFENKDFVDIIKETDSLYGSLFVAYDDETAFNFYKNFCEERGSLLFNFGIPDTFNPYNRLLLSPKTITYKYYKRIVFLDKPLYAPEELHKNNKIYVIDKNDLDDNLCKLELTRELLKTVYVELKRNETVISKCNNVLNLYKTAFNKSDVTYNKFLICIAVFIELGLMKIDDQGTRIKDEKVDLNKSVLYKKMKK